MVRFFTFRRTRMLQLVSAVAVGFIFGAITVTLNLGHQVDRLILEKKNLSNQLAGLEKELAQIEENLAKRRALAINSIEAHITFPKDTFSKYEGSSFQIEIEKKVVAMLQPLNGKEINKLEHELIPQIVEGRRITVDNREFLLRVRTVIISQQLIIYVLAEPVKATKNTSSF